VKRRFLLPGVLVALVLLAVVGVAVFLLTGEQKLPPPDTYLQTIQARGTLRVGIDPTYPPFDTIENGAVSGRDADLSRQIAEAIGVKGQFVPMALDTLYDGLAAGKVDILVSALPFIYERQKDVRYSQPYFQAGQMLVARVDDTSITAPLSLKGKQVAVELGSEADTEARKLARDTVPDLHVLSIYRSPDEALDALARGEAEAAITDNLSAEEYARSHPGSVRIMLPPLTDDPYVIAMPVRAESLAQRINATIDSLRASGKLAEIMTAK